MNIVKKENEIEKKFPVMEDIEDFQEESLTNDDLKKRLGKIGLNRDLLVKTPDFNYLKLIFSNFYPVHSEIVYESNGFEGIVVFYGYSKYFRELKIEEGEPTPTYKMEFGVDKEGMPIINSVEEFKD